MEQSFFADDEGRLEDVAAGFFRRLSIGAIRRAIDSGEITLNNARAARDAAVRPGDIIELTGAAAAAEIVPAGSPLPVIFEDDSLIVVDKPAGLPVVPERGADGWDFMARLLYHARDCRRCGAANVRFRIVHRLDRDTSGAVVVAKTIEAARALGAAFAAGGVEKRYLALVRGTPQDGEGRMDAPLGPGRGRRVMAAAPDGKPSITEWRLAERFRGFALLEVRPLTGRTHQIRVHLAWAGLPLAVDAMYGPAAALCLSEFKRDYRGRRAEKPLIARLTLHCAKLAFDHPTGGRVEAAAQLPADFERALKALRKYARL